MKLSHILEYIIFQIVAGIIRILPLKLAQWKGAFLGQVVYSVFGYRKSVTLDNLRRAFPERSEPELDTIARGAFRNVGISLFELLYFPRLTSERIRRLVHFENPALVHEIFGRGKGIILLTAHFGNWELLAQGIPACIGIPTLVIVKPQSNPYVDRSINARRLRFGNSTVPMDSSVREILRTLGNGGAVGIVGDQTAAKENIWINFFGRDVPTHQGPAVFCLKTGAPLLIMFSIRQPDGSYKILWQEVPTGDLSGSTDENVVELTKRHVGITEEFIRRYPDHWMWMHKRWKHVPELELHGAPSE